VVLQVLADPREVFDDVDTECAELLRVPDPGELEKLRRVDRTGSMPLGLRVGVTS
jgi:hypothetical protein